MKEYLYPYREGIKVGIAPSDNVPSNTGGFRIMQGAYTNDNVVQGLEDLEQVEFDNFVFSYPFPQIFELTSITLVCGSSTVYELLSDGTLEEKIRAFNGGTWTVADYNRFIVLTNGSSMIIRDGLTGMWKMYDGCEIPDGLCVCNLNGQLVIGGPETRVSAGFRG